ncbi:MAG: ATP-binding protein [Deinococcus sp.]|nr:ATP-binding protein [Deinococcus sp.]
MRAWCELPEAMQAMTFDALLPRLKAGGWGDALKFCQAYAQGEAPEKWVRLWGPPGTGKTHLGVAIVNYRLAHGQFAKYVYVADWLSALRATFERQRPQDNDAPLFATYEQVWQSYANAPLLLLDDLGAQHRTPWSDAELDRLLDHRYRLALETVVTTNAATVGILGGRVSDRLQDKGLIKGLHLPGPSYRPENRRVRP